MSDAEQAPAVLAVVVATDGEATLGRSLDALLAQDHPNLTVVGVDNGSRDGSRALLLDRLPASHVFVADRDLGFGNAVGMAMDAAVGRDHELVLFVHDDLALEPDAVGRLVATMQADDDLAIVGCKLVEWDDTRRLQAVGMSVDVTGRADPGVEPDELDQGQRDHESRALYVSTAGMLVRRDRFDRLGRFDHRYHLFRDDLDLCWRAWLWGWSVEVVPDAVAAHDQSAATYKRLGQTAFLGPRYFAERNTLATLLKNYGWLRLVGVLPLFLVVGVLKVAGFVLTRRLGDAWQTVRAWVWNVLHLRETLRLRRPVQAHRARTDAELSGLFARVTARVRAYAEAVGSAVTGGEDQIRFDVQDEDTPSPGLVERLRERLRTSPVGIAASLLLVLGLVVSVPLLSTAPVVGGELAPWPAGIATMLRSYAEPWTVGDLPAVAAVTPAQALLSIPATLAAGVSWIAPRVLLLSVVPLAWAASLRAGRTITDRRLPRVAGATLYALSPPLLAALRTGRIGSAVAAAVAPLVVVAAHRATAPGVPRDRAWRAVAAAALAAATTIAFAPVTAALVTVAAVGGAIGLALGPRDDRGERLLRLGVAAVLTALLLLPWSPLIELRRRAFVGDVALGDAPGLWSLLLLTPDLPGFPSAVAGIGLAAAVVLGVALARRRGASVGLLVVFLAAVGAAWRLALLGPATAIWVGAPLVVAALAAGGLLVSAIDGAEEGLGAHDFGWRQLAAVAVAVVVVVGTLASAGSVVGTAWQGYSEESPLPAHLASEQQVEGVGPFRVLVLGDAGADVRWAITDADGPSVASWGHRLAPAVAAQLDAEVDAVLGAGAIDAAARLGRLGIRYVVVPDEGASERLLAALGEQLDLDRQPTPAGAVYAVSTWLPRWSVVPADATDALAAGRPLGPGQQARAVTPELVEGESGELLLLADPVVPGAPGVEVVTADDEVVAPTRVGDVTAWQLPADPVEVRRVGSERRLGLLAVQVVVLLAVVSLSLRAPRFARDSRARVATGITGGASW